MIKKQKLEEQTSKGETLVEEEQTEEIINIYMLVDSAYQDGYFDMDTVYDYYDIIVESGLHDFVGTIEECVNALNAALDLFRIKNGLPNGEGPKVHVCDNCGGYYITAN